MPGDQLTCWSGLAEALRRRAAPQAAKERELQALQLVWVRDAAEALEVSEEVMREIAMAAKAAMAAEAAAKAVALEAFGKTPKDWTVSAQHGFQLLDEKLPLFDNLLAATLRSTRTRDRTGGVPQALQVRRVQKIENLNLWTRQRQHAIKMFQRRGTSCDWPKGSSPPLTAAHIASLTPVEDSLNEHYLFHGCSQVAAKAIARNNFNLALAGTHGDMFGRGMYFAESAMKADEYTSRGDDGLRCLLVCRVLLGKLKHTEVRMPRQSCCPITGSYDSVLGDRERCVGTYREFVTFDADAIYPAYIVWYTRSR